jgi:hypothetical protein
MNRLKSFLTYPTGWGIDLKSHWKSIWLGWWLITWRSEWDNHYQDYMPKDVHISFMPSP